MMLLTIITYFLCVNFALTVYHTNDNSTDIFEVFKEKYNKKYKNAAKEETHFKTFVENLNIVDKLNEHNTETESFFILNQHADLNPEEIEEQYAIKIKPYYNVRNKEDAEIVGRQKGRELNSTELFNLDNAVELYKDFMKNNKRNYTKKRDQTAHFYRFVKTLVEINKKNYEGNKTLALDENADVIKEPNEYFY